MENKPSNIESLIEKAGDYAETRMDLFKMQFVNKSSDVASSYATKLILILTAFLFLTILNIGVSLWLGELTGKSYYGFFIVSGFYAITGLILYACRYKWLKEPIANSIIRKSFK
jgi:hypothetical protein